MIQPPALPAVPGLPMLGDASPAKAAEGLEGADFGALLTIETDSQTAPGLAPIQPLAAAPVTQQTLPPAAILPEGGKTLPDPLPAEPGIGASQLLASPAPEAVQPARSAAGIPPIAEPTADEPAAPMPAWSVPAARPAALPESGSQPDLSDSAPPTPRDTPGAVLAQITPELAQQVAASHAAAPSDLRVIPNGPVQLTRTTPAPPESAAVTAPPNAAPSAFPVVTLPAAPPTLRGAIRLRLTLPSVAAAGPVSRSASEIGQPQVDLMLPASGLVQAQKDAEPLAAGFRSVVLATLAAERPRAPGKTATVAPGDLVLGIGEPIAPATALPAATVQAMAAAPAFTPAEPTLRPHDFTQLVDRLVAARELAAPQTFQVAIQHGEFGPVQLRFQREGEGLNVAMASADPDFARAVSTAPAPVLPALPVDPAAPGGSRNDSPSHSASNNGHSAQHRGASPERREDRHGPAGNPAAPRAGERGGSRRGGIFA